MRIRIDAGLEAGRNRCQFLLTLPIALAIGGLYGLELSRASGVDPFLSIPLGALGLATFVYVQLILEPLVVHHVTDDTGRWDSAVAFVWDALIGAVVGLPLFWYLGVRPLPAMAAAAGAGFAYGWIAGWVVCGGAVETFLGTVTGSLSGKRRAPDYSQIQALEARGDYESARVEYRKVLDGDPTNIAVATRMARLLADQQNRPVEALEVIRVALSAPRVPPDRWAYALRILVEICTVRMGDDTLALPDLRRLAEAHPHDANGLWAAQRIARIEAHAPEE